MVKMEPVKQEVFVEQSEKVRDPRGNKRIYNDQKMLAIALKRGFPSEREMLIHLHENGRLIDSAKELKISYYLARERMLRWGITMRKKGELLASN